MKMRLSVLAAVVMVCAGIMDERSRALAQATTFSYQGRLDEGGTPVTGSFDFQFTLYGSESGGPILAGPIAQPSVGVTNGLFTVSLDFGGSVFDGSPRFLEITVAPGGGGVVSTLSPRQPLRSTPYALKALSASSVPAGSITGSMLAAGSAAANLLDSGLSGVARGGVILSELEYASNLVDQGYVRLGKADLIPESWRALTNGPPLGALQVLARKDFAAVWTGTDMIVWGGTDAGNTGGRYNPASDTWTPITTSNAPSPQSSPFFAWTGTHLIVWGNNGPVRGGRYHPATDTWLPLSETNAPVARTGATAIWTGTYLIIWGGSGLNTGARYDPAANVWSNIAPNAALAGRGLHSAVWTGTEMIVWGGNRSDSCGFVCVTVTNFNDGGRYNPVNNTWQPMTPVGVPLKRYSHSAVWTGTEMIIWGGRHGEGTFAAGTNINSGARYNPSLNQWVGATAVAGAPSAREGHVAHWTGSQMLIWGGFAPGASHNDGGLYTPGGNWIAMNAVGAPEARTGPGTVLTGSEMLLWGGELAPGTGTYPQAGRRYNLANNSWSILAAGGDPTGMVSPRTDPTALWTGFEMLAWGGGSAASNALGTGGRLNPSQPRQKMWSNLPLVNAPTPRTNHTMVGTGGSIIVWGGKNGAQELNDGRIYSLASNAWTSVSTADAPAARGRHVAVWTGNRMVVWGGVNGTKQLANGGRFDPVGNTWQGVAGLNAPAARADAAAVWTGSEMIVWGGMSVTDGVTNILNTGGRYDPVSDTWQPLPGADAPLARFDHTAVWTGSEMIVWGGETGAGKANHGARYSPAANRWVALSGTDAPAGRAQHTAVWAGSQMVVWGGFDGSLELATGGRYDPVRDAWASTTITNAPLSRQGHAAVWSGAEMIIWAGQRWNGGSQVFLDDAYAYAPARTMYLYMKP